MTHEEAIKILHPDTTLMALAEVEYFGGFNGEEAKIKAVEEVCVIACEALEKQITKPVLNHNINHGICPNCGSYVAFAWHEKACGDCGQALDWSD